MLRLRSKVACHARWSRKSNLITRNFSSDEMYEKKSPLEHILLRPGMYVGQMEPASFDTFIIGSDGMMKKSPVFYSPGLLKIYDEIIVNASDNRHRDRSMTSIAIDVSYSNDSLQVSVCNNGKGIPVSIHSKEKIYNVELIFGHLLTGSNFNDTQDRLMGGSHGYGAKLTNIFSTRFEVETYDKKRGLLYKQIWENNKKDCSDPVVEKLDFPEDYTKITFSPDLRRFGIIPNGLNNDNIIKDILSMFQRRAFDIAACSSPINVSFNGQELKVHNFTDYLRLFTQGRILSSEDDLNSSVAHPDDIFYSKINHRWEIAVKKNNGFDGVSFVNSVWTTKGGTHVGEIVNQLVTGVLQELQKRGATATPAQIRNKLMIFVRSDISNPSFNSQSKDALTTIPPDFGSNCLLSKKFVQFFVKSSGIVDELILDSLQREELKLKRISSTRKSSHLDIEKLEDAHWAGTPTNNLDCTLILTEGDSAKALAVAGLEVVGRKTFGVLPLRGKILNVRDSSKKQIASNKEIVHLVQALGLDFSKTYATQEERNSLRYGHVMIMCDQDHDGSHIKGLFINFIQHFWPKLLEWDGFFQQFITPLVKVSSSNKKEPIQSFYSLQEYMEWRKNSVDDGDKFSIKYYKGLGTSTAKEGRDYFSNLERHRKYFTHENEDANLIDMAFRKSRAADSLSFGDFIDKELIHFSMHDNIRSIPSVVDGLKPSQRKVLYGCFKRKLYSETKVVQLAGYISEATSYHHGEASLHNTIINMAQDFVGSNNIPLLLPLGQFGTRSEGGKDFASPRYIFTQLSPLSRWLFPESDDRVLQYLEEDGITVEPRYFIPVIPTLLINGSKGIGTGWSTSIPSYNPRDLLRYVENLVRGIPNTEPLQPWVRGFKGKIDVHTKGKSSVMISSGMADVNGSKIEISELPVGVWTNTYKSYLQKLRESGSIKSFYEDHTHSSVKFTVHVAKGSPLLEDATNENLLANFRLKKKQAMNNMIAFDSKGKIASYRFPEEIAIEHAEIRHAAYIQRKSCLEKDLSIAEKIARNKCRFIHDITSGKMSIINSEELLLNDILSQQGYDSMDSIVGSTSGSRPFAYLLDMPIHSLTQEKIASLDNIAEKTKKELSVIQSQSSSDLWLEDLKQLDRQYFDIYEKKK